MLRIERITQWHAIEHATGTTQDVQGLASLLGECLLLATTEHPKLLSQYRSDLLHDGIWVAEHWQAIAEGRTFFWALRETGTSIGTDRELVGYIEYCLLYRVRVELAPDATRKRFNVTFDRLDNNSCSCRCSRHSNEEK